MTVTFEPEDGRPGFTVVDGVEGRRFPLTTERPVELGPGEPDRFREPVDVAATCRLTAFETPHLVTVNVHDVDDDSLTQCHDFADESFPHGEYELEVMAPIRIFLRVRGPVRVRSSNTEMRVSFGGARDVAVAARAMQQRPTATVTATADPTDLMAAISTFGSALKTTSPERSYPSYRDHPPEIEVGEELHVPESVSPPETGIRIEVPRRREAVYSVATLACYLGASVRPGESARLLADGEVLRTLEGPDGLSGAVTETLKRVFLLDCVVREVGFREFDLDERHRLQERVDLPCRELYDAPIAERVSRYLSIPAETVLDLVPDWHLAVHVSPAPSSAQLLPYAADTLALVAVDQPGRSAATQRAPPGYESLVGSTEPATSPPRYFSLSGPAALERAWVGEGRAINADDLLLPGVRHRVREESSSGSIDIDIVCNDDAMSEEVGDGNRYGDRDELPFEVTVHEGLTRGDLRSLLASDLDFFHYVGHVEREGFVCRDGHLDARDLESVGVGTFFLNGCRSYEQGMALVERGSAGGIVTHSDVDHPDAAAVGQLVAGLLNAGFTLRSTLSVADRRHSIEGRYDVVGDGGVQVAQPENGNPTLVAVDPGSDDLEYEVRITVFPTLEFGMGTCYSPYAPSVDRYFLVGGELPAITLSVPEVVNFLGLERVPAVVDGELRWSTDVGLTELP